jgi:hypothetical protein
VRPVAWQLYYTNTICSGNTAIISASNGNITCATLPTWGDLPPTCGEGGTPIFTWGQWDCQLILLWAGASDPNWTWSITGDISNSNNGNVGIATTNPGAKLNVSGSFLVDQNTEEALYCYANDTWIPVSRFNQDVCMGCEAGYSYSKSSQMCEKVNCGWGGPPCASAFQTPIGQLLAPANWNWGGDPPDAYRDNNDGMIYVNGMLDIDLSNYDIVIRYSSGMGDVTWGAIIEQAGGLTSRFSGSVYTPWWLNYMVEIKEHGLPSCTMYRYNF